MKTMMLSVMGLLVIGGWHNVNAQTPNLNLPLIGTVDITTMLSNSGAIAAYDNHGTKWAGASMRVAWTPADPAQAIADLEVGALWDATTGAPSGLTSAIGLRLDNIATKLGTSAWIKKNVGWLPVPSIEIGPFGGYLTVTKQWIWGVFIAKKIG